MEIKSAFYLLGGFWTNVPLTIFNVVSTIMLFYVLIKYLKIHRYNPYRTSPFCTVSMIMAIPSLNLVAIQVVYSINLINFWTLGLIWSAIFLNLWLAFYAFLIWKGLFIRGIVIHINMLLNAIYLILIALYDTLYRPLCFISIFIGILTAAILFWIHHAGNYGPAPVHITKELKKQTEKYIQILDSKKEIKTLEELTQSQNDYVRKEAEKTLKLVREDKIPRTNLKNNLFLLLLIDKGISIGRYRKIFYKKKSLVFR
ncbi:MAG: hypothetical protein ACTSRG_13555 [Candidatus Helarchaeota archaeon]